MKKLILSIAMCLLIASYALPSAASNTKTVVYYFWNKPKCISCVKIESYTKEAIAELHNEDIEYKVIDFGQKQNQHYAKRYGLYTKTVILSKVEGGKEVKHKNLNQIWMKLNNESDFKHYIKNETQKFME